MDNNSKNRRRAVVILVMIALGTGWLASSILQGPRNSPKSSSEHAHGSEKQPKIWTCAMHPHIQLPKPGKCPLCGMALIPLASHDGEGMPSVRRLVMSPDAAKLAEIQTAEVERKFVSTEIRMVGKVEYDETKIAYITAWAGGRIDRLYIDQTGVPVRKGDHLAYLYSPELLAAQEEYLQSLEGAENVKASHLDIIKSTSQDTIKNSREKLKLLGVTDEQIAELEKQKVPSDHMTIYATATGIVVNREVQEGTYVQTGSRIYSIVDLSEVWVKLDAYEKDLEWLRYGQDVEFEAEAYPGEIFHGRISFIAPILDETTRTVKVRVNVKNEAGQLKPGMFVRSIVRAQVAGLGRVMAPDLEGKWMCPMHPEIIQEESGACPICEMPLVPTEKMGYIKIDEGEAPIVIPASAVLKTGKRAVVYVQNQQASKPTFEGREIVLGPRAGNHYLVKSGLAEGERVVVNGNFKIDSALQIQAKPSMMNPEGGAGGGGHDMSKMDGSRDAKQSDQEMAPEEFLEQLSPVYEAYFEYQTALAMDDFEKAKAALGAIKEAFGGVDMNLLEDQLHAKWMDLDQRINNSIVLGLEAQTIEDIRTDVLEDMSGELISLERTFGHVGAGDHYKVFCPMASAAKGAAWLQSNDQIMNPFFGKEMQTCGTLQDKFASRRGSAHVH
ncbi:MAG: efflux RND transporter periplasmic adaptor subunit [Candidatus Omnitrophota bacterium]|nr:efflux RND transporter periplasmic adaptor subunit [Candidatus Omnitrophota bacterium]